MILLGCYSATIYKVGDSDGWTAKDDVYYRWTERKEFHVGDYLVFQYDHNFNNVTQVSRALESQFCDSSFPIVVYNTGHDVITLTKPGSYFFITSNYTQCSSGQKLEVLVVHDPSRPVPPPPSQVLPLEKIYKVGDSKGWRVYDSNYYYRWSQKKEFHVGNNLLFEYGQELNDVLEISGNLEFLYCDPASPAAVHKTGCDLVRLTNQEFISSKPGHCEAGLKLQVVVGPTTDFPKMLPMDGLTRWSRTLTSHHH
ncbi:hypothetical protein EUTSA_v10000646mg [Eutrema salsugineum]|uniref:Phytocyanin domain-containing protein n=1 Tax=Eutrema salsugineum TaxID=72664 RepID=V4NJY8_EUTSA|nr:hypothetical protein EUTSA_v10000646mg [Eutrema salsugineum]